MRFRDLFKVSFSSDTTKSVPIFLPSRPSRAISTASWMVLSNTSVSHFFFGPQICSKIIMIPRYRWKIIDLWHPSLDTNLLLIFECMGIRNYGIITVSAEWIGLILPVQRNLWHPSLDTNLPCPQWHKVGKKFGQFIYQHNMLYQVI